MIADHAPVMLAQCDRSHRYLFANRRYTERFGLEPSAIVGKTIPEVLGEEAFATLRSYITRALAGEAVSMETSLRYREGQERYIQTHFAPERDEQGVVQSYVVAITDITEQRRADLLIRRQAEVLEQTHDAILVWEIGNGIVSWNAGAERMYGFAEREVLGHVSHELLRTALPEERASFERRLLNERRWSGELQHHGKDGRQLTVESRMVVFQGERGQALVIESNRDISRRRRAEEALREMQQRFRNMADSSPVMIWVTEPDGYCTYLNARWYEFTGQTPEQALGFGWLKAVHTDDAPKAESLFRNATKEGKPFYVEYRLRRHDGVYRWAIDAAAPRFDERGSFLGFVGSVLDITERREIEDALRGTQAQLSQKEQQLRAVTDATPALISFVDAEGRYGYVNYQYEVWFGHRAEQIVGRHVRDVLGEAAAEKVWPHMQRALNGEKVRYEMNVPYQHAGNRWVDVAYVPRRDDAGRVDGFFVLVTDITARKRTDILLDAQKRSLEMIVAGAPLTEVLTSLARAVEEQSEGQAVASILLLDGEGRLRNGASPGLPQHYLDAIDGIQSDPKLGTCASAAATGEVVITPSFDTDPRWTAIKHLPMNIGFCGAWSQPIKTRDGRVLGTFGTYFREVREPAPSERQAVEILARTAALAIERNRDEEALKERTRSLELLNRVSSQLVAERELDRIVQSVTDAGREISGAQFGAFFYNVTNEKGEAYTLYTLSGVPRSAFEKFPMPRNTHLFGPTFRGEGVTRIDDVLKDPRYGKNEPYQGMPPGHLPVRSYLAVPVLSRNGGVLGGLFYGHPEPGVFTAEVEAVMTSLAAQAAIAIDNANLYQALQRELSKHKRAEEALRQTQERFDLVLNAADMGVWFCDLPFDKLSWDVRVKEHFWLSPEAEVTIDTFYEHLHPDDRERTRLAIEKSISEHKPYNIEYRTVSPSGQVKWIRAIGRGFYNEAGEPIRFDGVTLDITDMVKARETLAERRAELERLVDERTTSLREAITQMEEFSYSVSHDLRAPLRAMKGYAQILLMDYGPQLDETARHYLDRISRAGERMDKLTHDVLTLSRVGRTNIVLSNVELAALISDVIVQYPTLQEPAAEIHVQAPHRVRAHEPSLGQAVANLLGNAVKFVPDGRKPRVKVWSEESGDKIRLLVRDNGIGIKPEHQGKLFGMFERVHPNEGFEGTGVGLAIVRKALERMGGSVGMHSDGENGSTFWIELPKAHTAE
jgi:PAS domain S-box-containing protein